MRKNRLRLKYSQGTLLELHKQYLSNYKINKNPHNFSNLQTVLMTFLIQMPDRLTVITHLSIS